MNGVEIDKVYTKLYTKEKETYKLQGYVYQNFKTTESGVAYIYFSQDLINEFGVTKDDAANLVSCLDSIKGSLIWVAFIAPFGKLRTISVTACKVRMENNVCSSLRCPSH